MLTLPVAALAATMVSAAPKIISASVFTNGYAFITREIPVHGSGIIKLDPLPTASAGTFILRSTKGVEIKSIRRTEEQATGQKPVESLTDLLKANIGHSVKVGILGGDERLATQESGKLLSADSNLVLIQSGEGVVAIPRDKISMMSSSEGSFTYKQPVTNTKSALEIKVEASGEGKIIMQGLQSGMTWAPSYTVDLIGDNQMDITAKAIVINGIDDMDGADVRLVNGLPNLSWIKSDDPLLSGEIAFDHSGGVGLVPNVPYITYDPSDNSVVVQGTDKQIGAAPHMPAAPPVPMTPAENLYFYHLSSVSLKKGDRGSYQLFEKQLPCEHRYHCYLQPTGVWGGTTTSDVSDELDFTNSQENPLAPAPASVFKDGEIVAQSNFGYTSPHGKGSLYLSQASDIHVSATMVELARQNQALTLPDKSVFDLVTEQETITVENLEKKTIKIELDKIVGGTILKAEGSPTISKASAPNGQNPTSDLDWKVTVPAGGKASYVVSYKTYERISQ
ncbi:MAG TPA: hypothetical protein VGL56_17515 [Fimbriimonadaceae bacterium]|jgi:hypothetical protein